MHFDKFSYVSLFVFIIQVVACSNSADDPSIIHNSDNGVIEQDGAINQHEDLSSTQYSDNGVDITSAAICGNGIAENDEACDQNDLQGKTCKAFGFYQGQLACDKHCQFDKSLCSNCGNNIVDDKEECDGASLDGKTCKSLGFDRGSLYCGKNCLFDKSKCTHDQCGDGLINGNEDCDGSKLDNQTCKTLGFETGKLRCSKNCFHDISDCRKCGDGKKNQYDEYCDKTDLDNQSCKSKGYTGGTLKCDSNCDFDTSACYTCGDHKVFGPEECDKANLNNKTCKSLGFDGGTLSCSSTCQLNTDDCYKCGDGVKNGNEECDQSDLGGAKCADFFLMTGGTLGCHSSCRYDMSKCIERPWRTNDNMRPYGELASNIFWFESTDTAWFASESYISKRKESDYWYTAMSASKRMVKFYPRNKNDILAIDSSGKLYRYDGHKWNNENIETKLGLSNSWGVQVKDAWRYGDKIWIVGIEGPSYYQNKKNIFCGFYDGSSWKNIKNLGLEYEEYSLDIFGINTNSIWLIDGGSVYFYNGSIWSKVKELENVAINSMWGNSYNDVWAVGDKGVIYHFNGQSWLRYLKSPITSDLFSIKGKSASDIWALSPSELIHYDGTQWSSIFLPSPKPRSIQYANSDMVVRTAQGYYIWKGTQWDRIFKTGIEIYGDMKAIWGYGSSTYILTEIGSNSKVNDVWRCTKHQPCSKLPKPAGENYNAIFGTSESNIWIVGRFGSIEHYNGKSWKTISSPTKNDLNALWIDSTGKGWIVGDNGTLLRLSNTKVSLVASQYTTDYKTIWGVSSKDIWVAGKNTFLHYDGSWKFPDFPNHIKISGDFNIKAIWGAKSDAFWAISNGRVYKWDGSFWTVHGLTPKYNSIFETIHGNSSNHFYISDSSQVYHYTGRFNPLTMPAIDAYSLIWINSDKESFIANDYRSPLFWR